MVCMVELGELEKHHADFASRNVRVVVVSIEGQEAAKKTQEDFPHLLVISDSDQKLAKRAELIHLGGGKSGEDTLAPTTILVDRTGIVKLVLRPERHIHRLSAGELLEAVDTAMPSAPR